MARPLRLITTDTPRLLMMREFLSVIERQSHCERNKVGALLTNKDLDRIIAFGYNGNVAGGPNSCDQIIEGACGCVHAEANALVKQRTENPFMILSSVSPCLMCAKLIINAGIEEICFVRRYRDTSGIELFQKMGIHYFQLEAI